MTSPTHTIDACVTSADWASDQAHYATEQDEEDRMSEQLMSQDQYEATDARLALADHLEDASCDAAGIVILLHLGAETGELVTELHALVGRLMLLRQGLLHNAPVALSR
jgi:hypothetical protein